MLQWLTGALRPARVLVALLLGGLAFAEYLELLPADLLAVAQDVLRQFASNWSSPPSMH